MLAPFISSAASVSTLSLTLEGKPFRVLLTPAARRALDARSTPLVAEMEYYFSCLIRLKVRFYEGDPEASATPVTDRLAVRFRPVMSRACEVHASGGRAPLTDFPIVRRAAFVPHWLKLDFRRGEWTGEFGYKTPPA